MKDAEYRDPTDPPPTEDEIKNLWSKHMPEILLRGTDHFNEGRRWNVAFCRPRTFEESIQEFIVGTTDEPIPDVHIISFEKKERRFFELREQGGGYNKAKITEIFGNGVLVYRLKEYHS